MQGCPHARGLGPHVWDLIIQFLVNVYRNSATSWQRTRLKKGLGVQEGHGKGHVQVGETRIQSRQDKGGQVIPPLR